MSFPHDLRYGIRVLSKAPLFTVGAIVVLALGIGTTTAMFSLVDAALIRPLPFPDSERLVMVYAECRRTRATASRRSISWTFKSRTDRSR
jgi:hypothetical protein